MGGIAQAAHKDVSQFPRRSNKQLSYLMFRSPLYF